MVAATGKPNEHIQVPIRTSISHLSENSRRALSHLAFAVRAIDPIFFAQRNQDLKETGGIFDKSKRPYFYPEDLTAEEFEAYLDRHPKEAEALKSPFTVVRRSEGGLAAVPYADIHTEELEVISASLIGAAEYINHDGLRRFLFSKAQAFRSNEYRESDIDWINIGIDAPLELTIGPYEEYADDLMGIKRTFEGMLGVTLPDETKKLCEWQELAGEFDAYLGEKFGYTTVGKQVPMVVVDEIIAAGMLRYDFIAGAYNLPNDRDIHEEVGSKKVFLRNIIEARLAYLTRPIVERLAPQLLPIFDLETFLNFIQAHEICHGIGFSFHGAEFKTLGSPFEESKADVGGLIFLYFLADCGVIDREVADNAVIVNLIDGLRQLRVGLEEAHAFGSRLQYQWLVRCGALGFEGTKFTFNTKLFRPALEGLLHKFFLLTQKESFAETKRFADRWGDVLPELRLMIAELDGLPVDIDPVFDW